jgi:prepilin-type N-terminal cleavage/methylation domain-containing protein
MNKLARIHRPRGFTLVELMTTLMIFALIATAATSMMASSANTQKYVLNNVNAVSSAELAFRRIVENIRSASQCTCPTAAEIDLVTQPDTSKTGNPVYNIQYTIVGSQLMEFDDRYGAAVGVGNVLATNVTTFNVTVVQSTKPTMYQLTLTLSPPNSAPITRQAYITSRNF